MEHRTYRETMARQEALNNKSKELEEQRRIRDQRAELQRRQRAQLASYLSQGEQNARQLDWERRADERAEEEEQQRQAQQDIDNYNSGNFDAIRDAELRSYAQTKRANQINQFAEEERAKRGPQTYDIVNAVLDSTPILGDVKKFTGLKLD